MSVCLCIMYVYGILQINLYLRTRITRQVSRIFDLDFHTRSGVSHDHIKHGQPWPALTAAKIWYRMHITGFRRSRELLHGGRVSAKQIYKSSEA